MARNAPQQQFTVRQWEQMMESLTTPANLLRVEFALRLLNLGGLTEICVKMKARRDADDEYSLHILFCTLVGVVDHINNPSIQILTADGAYKRGLDIAKAWHERRKEVV